MERLQNKKKDVTVQRRQKKCVKQTGKRSMLNQEQTVEVKEQIEKKPFVVMYEKMEDDIVFDIDLVTLHTYGSKDMVLVQKDTQGY